MVAPTTRGASPDYCRFSPHQISIAVPEKWFRAAVENLISAGFKPARKVVLAFGFDEEASGLQVNFLSSP